MSETRGDARYTMGRSKEEEEERLIQQSQLYDAVTRRLLNMAGLGRGMRVLDIGSGTGDVAMTAAEVVGPEGAVVGVDVNPAILETARARAGEAGFENVEFVAGDARTLDLGGDFDALIGRLVLMYMADPADALRQLAVRLRPGGIVAFQEVDFSPYRNTYHDDTPLMNQLVDWGLGVFERSGAHLDMGSTCTAPTSRPACPSRTCTSSPPWAVPRTGRAIPSSPTASAAWSRCSSSSGWRRPTRSTWIPWPSASGGRW